MDNYLFYLFVMNNFNTIEGEKINLIKLREDTRGWRQWLLELYAHNCVTVFKSELELNKDIEKMKRIASFESFYYGSEVQKGVFRMFREIVREECSTRPPFSHTSAFETYKTCV